MNLSNVEDRIWFFSLT